MKTTSRRKWRTSYDSRCIIFEIIIILFISKLLVLRFRQNRMCYIVDNTTLFWSEVIWITFFLLCFVVVLVRHDSGRHKTCDGFGQQYKSVETEMTFADGRGKTTFIFLFYQDILHILHILATSVYGPAVHQISNDYGSRLQWLSHDQFQPLQSVKKSVHK